LCSHQHTSVSNAIVTSKNNEMERRLADPIDLLSDRTFRVDARLRRLGYRFGLHAHPHTGKQLSPVAGFAGGPSTARSDDNDDNDRDDGDDEGAHGLTSPTVADVRRRARQSTCHATPGSFELIARAPLSPPSRIPSSPCPPISSHSSLLVRFFSFLLLFTPPPPHPLPPALLLPSCWLYTGFVISLAWMRPVAMQAERCRCTWYLSALNRPAEVLHRMGMARGK